LQKIENFFVIYPELAYFVCMMIIFCPVVLVRKFYEFSETAVVLDSVTK